MGLHSYPLVFFSGQLLFFILTVAFLKFSQLLIFILNVSMIFGSETDYHYSFKKQLMTTWIPNTLLLSLGQHNENKVKCLMHTNFKVCIRHENRENLLCFSACIQKQEKSAFFSPPKGQKKISLLPWTQQSITET